MKSPMREFREDGWPVSITQAIDRAFNIILLNDPAVLPKRTKTQYGLAMAIAFRISHVHAVQMLGLWLDPVYSNGQEFIIKTPCFDQPISSGSMFLTLPIEVIAQSQKCWIFF